MRRLLVAMLAASLCALTLAVPTPAADPGAGDELVMVVMDPLAADLACKCVAGYAQRDYALLGKYLSKQTGRPVKVYFAETVTGALTRKTSGRADLIIGKDSMVRHGGKENKLDLSCVAALTGKDGKTSQTGLWVVAARDPALAPGDLKGYEMLLGPEDAEEKFTAAIKLLKDLDVPVPGKYQTAKSCTECATQLLELHKSGKKAAGVISSYAQPLLEGCGTIKKGELRVIGETDPVPFITAFVNNKLPAADRAAIEKALLVVGKDEALCKKLESSKGFLAAADAGKKK